MRIIAGQFRGRALATVGKGDMGAHLRPTTDRVRESLFSVLTHLDVIEGARVLDLFAGTGALGLEALSRGAASAHFVENGRASLGLLAANIRDLDAKAIVTKRDATKLANTTELHHLVFLDPPYGAGLGAKALLSAAGAGWIAPKALIVWEENAEQFAPDGFQALETKRYGDTWITFLTYDP